VADLVEEAARPDIAGTGLLGIRVVEAVDVPVAVLGEPGDHIALGHQQVPQRLGGAYPAGEPAAHADDGDRLIGGEGLVECLRPLGRGGGGAPGDRLLAEHLGVQIPGQNGGGRVVEDTGDRQPEAGDHAEAVAQFDGGQRVESEVAEGAVGLHRVGAVVAEDVGRLVAHQLLEELGLLGGGQLRHLPAQRGDRVVAVARVRTSGGSGAVQLGHLAEQRVRT
jgi:hypothetical protein